MQFKIFGTDRRTGRTLEPIILESEDQGAASDLAVVRGMMVTRIERMADVPPPLPITNWQLPEQPAVGPAMTMPTPNTAVLRGGENRLSTPVRVPHATTPSRLVQPAPQFEPDPPFLASNEYPLLNVYRYVCYFCGFISSLLVLTGGLIALATFFAGVSGEDFVSALAFTVGALFSAMGFFAMATVIELAFRLLESVNDVRQRLSRNGLE